MTKWLAKINKINNTMKKSKNNLINKLPLYVIL